MINIQPYISVDTLEFGKSGAQECRNLYGAPTRIRKNREGVEEHEYEEFIVRFDPESGAFRELTLLPGAQATVGSLRVTWDEEFLYEACKRDGDPRDLYGAIVLASLGIFVTGIHDHDPSQMAISAFSRGEFDGLMEEATTFDFSILRNVR